MLKKIIKKRPSLYYWLTMGLGGYVRMNYFKRFIYRYKFHHGSPTLLDAGFGRGEHLHWLEVHAPNSQLLGYDLAQTNTYHHNFSLAQQRLKKAVLLQMDLLAMRDQERFDAIFSIDVLEHIPNNAKVIENFFNALKSGGILYLAMPYDSPENDYLLPKRWLQSFIDWAEEEHTGEQRSLEALKALLEQIGFSVVEAHYTFTTPVRLLWEIQQILRKLPFQQVLYPLFNTLSWIEFLLPHPSHGNLKLIARKP